MTDFSDFMGMSIGDVPTAKVLEDGIFIFSVSNYFDKVVETKNGSTKVVTIRLTPTEVVESDFSPEDLELAENLRLEFWITKKALAMRAPHISLGRFIQTVLDLTDEEVGNLDFGTGLEMLLGKRFKAVAKKGVGYNDQPEANVTRIIEAA